MNLSAGLLHTACEMLHVFSTHEIANDAIESLPMRSWVVPVHEAINYTLKCGWVELDSQSYFRPSKRGVLILEQSDYQERLRIQIEDYVEVSQPRWGKLIPHGRVQTSNFMPADAKQCLREAGLFDSPPTENIVKWWDRLATKARGRHDDLLTDIGRAGEQLSIDYERKRIGQEPKWQSVESNSDGYDLLSYVSDVDDTRMSIEVKASTRSLARASFHLTRNEWKYAELSMNHRFHLWAEVHDNPLLAVLTVSDVEPHIPEDRGEGVWESTEIPFEVFKDKVSCEE